MAMSDGVTIHNLSGGNNQIGGSGSTFSQVIGGPSASEQAGGRHGRAPEHGLYVFADIVGYSKLTVRLQKVSQDYLARLLDDGVAEADVSPGLLAWQDQGDARMTKFPSDVDAGKILAVLPRLVNDELLARNGDMAPHARMRIRMAFTMGTSVPGATGLVGEAPIAVARLINWDPFRHAMTKAAQVQVGVIIDDHLHAQYIRQGFRADLDPRDYTAARVSYPDKGFDAAAWVKLFGWTGERVAEVLTSV
jgi:class 3 adenylate cyclase